MTGRRVLPVLAVLAVVVLGGMALVVRSLVGALPHLQTTTATSAALLVADGAGTAGTVVLTAPAGRTLPDSALSPVLPSRDEGAVRGQGERTSGQAVPAQGLRAVRVDARTVRWTWRVPGGAVVLMPSSSAVRVTRLTVTLRGAALASCLVSAGSTNGHPRLRPCEPSAVGPLTLDEAHNPLDLVRLRLATG